jgi:hypothetical protein
MFYKKWKHLETGIEFTGRLKSDVDNEKVDYNKFIQTGEITLDEYTKLLNNLLEKYPTKQFIFVNSLSKEVWDKYSNYEIYLLLCKYEKEHDNIHIVNMKKNEQYKNNDRLIGFIAQLIDNVMDPLVSTYDMNDMINQIIKNKFGKNINVSEFFLDSHLYHFDNASLFYLDESNKYLTNVLKINEELNNKKSSIGLYFTFNPRFIRTYQRNIKISEILSTPFLKLRQDIPIKEYKLIFYGRTLKIHEKMRFRIYTGNKWELIDKTITTNYQKFELTTVFNFTKNSQFRIGFKNIEPGSVIFINNPYLEILN